MYRKSRQGDTNKWREHICGGVGRRTAGAKEAEKIEARGERQKVEDGRHIGKGGGKGAEEFYQ